MAGQFFHQPPQGENGTEARQRGALVEYGDDHLECDHCRRSIYVFPLGLWHHVRQRHARTSDADPCKYRGSSGLWHGRPGRIGVEGGILVALGTHSLHPGHAGGAELCLVAQYLELDRLEILTRVFSVHLEGDSPSSFVVYFYQIDNL